MKENPETDQMPVLEAATPKKVIGALTEIEKLKMENIVLRSEKAQLLKERIAGDAEALSVLTEALRSDVETMRIEVAKRLGVADPLKLLIRKTGEVEEKL